MARAPSKTLGCFGMLDATSTSEDHEQWQNALGDLFGFTDRRPELDSHQAFRQFVSEQYKAPRKHNDTNVPTHLRYHMAALEAAHERTVALCHQQVRDNGRDFRAEWKEFRTR